MKATDVYVTATLAYFFIIVLLYNSGYNIVIWPSVKHN